MPPEDEPFELEPIARVLRAVSKETSYRGLAEMVLQAALGYCGAIRGAVLLSEGGELLNKLDADFSAERMKVFASQPQVDEIRLPADLIDKVVMCRETVVEHRSPRQSVLTAETSNVTGQETSLLCLPLTDRERTIGVLYLEADHEHAPFTRRRVSVMSILASQAAVSFESIQLFEVLRETNMWMVRGQEIGRMGSYRWNTRTLFSRASRECYRIFDIALDISPVPFQAFRDRVHKDDLPALEQSLTKAVNSQSAFSHEYRIVHADGTILHVVAVGEFDVGPSGDLELEGIITDVTEREDAEQALTDAKMELARAERLASLGELTASIVHEVNQPVTGIIASAQACLRWLARTPVGLDEARTSVRRIIEQGHRVSDVVRGLRSLVRQDQPRIATVQVNDAIEDVILLMKRELERAGVAVRTSLDTSLPEIEADKGQLQQVVLNLLHNAIDAMADVGGRTHRLTISSETVDGGVMVAIADTGVGIDAAIGDRLFDAFYTTKDGGLGLGLSICRKIVNAHGGRLWMKQNMKNGATFTFVVPVRPQSPALKSA